MAIGFMVFDDLKETIPCIFLYGPLRRVMCNTTFYGIYHSVLLFLHVASYQPLATFRSIDP